MRVQVHLRFTAEVETMEEAWDIADGLERAAVKRDFTAVSGWVETGEGSREGVLVAEGSAEVPTSEASRMERVPGLSPTGVGDAEGVLTPGVFGRED